MEIMTPHGEAAVADGEASGRARPRSRGSALLTWVGVLLIVSGLGMLAYVGWEFYGTTWVSQRKQADIVEKLEKEWGTQQSPAPAQIGTSGSTAEAIIRIPRFGSDYAIPVLDSIEDDALSAGFGHFPDSAKPGRKGNYALAAHRITHGEPLRRMPELQVGDEVVVETRTDIWTYVLTTGGDDLEVTFRDGWVVAPLPTNPEAGGVQPAQTKGQKLITLTTCAELFHTDQRMIAFGVLKDHESKDGASGRTA